MATKIICDHCGNQIPKAFIYCFGPYEEVSQSLAQQQMTVAQAAMAQGIAPNNLGNGQSMQSFPYLYPPNTPNQTTLSLSTVDLCQHCQIIWMKRVAHLTKQSDA